MTMEASRSTRAVPPWETGSVIAQRYLLGEPIGRGGFGTVFSARELASGTTVAVKRLKSGTDTSSPRFRHEVRTLLALRLPGVVRHLHDGEHAGSAYLVTDFVDGDPFPGIPIPAPWKSLAPRVIALLEAVSRVHGEGITHRDLKPENILVDHDGVPTILDFGLAWGPELGSRLTRAGAWVGTPQYLAPEQGGGRPADPRSDLFSLGVMLHECLTGELPFAASDLATLQERKLQGVFSAVRARVPDVPVAISDLIDRLLHPDPHRRPVSASAILETLCEVGGSIESAAPPWLGDTTVLERIRSAIETRSSLTIAGPHGSGRTRCLREAEQICEEHDRPASRARAGATAFCSLGHVTPHALACEGTLAEVTKRVRESLCTLLSDGTVLLADDLEGLDEHSRRLLSEREILEAGSVIRTTRNAVDADIGLQALAEEDLWPLFDGPERIVHLPSDAAHQLHRRTSGVPAQVFEELAAWERAGLCRNQGTTWRIDRGQIDRLSAGFERSAGLRIGICRTPLTDLQEQILAWIELAHPHGRASLLARLVELPEWEIESEIDELHRIGAVRAIPATERVQGGTTTSADPTPRWATVVTGLPGRLWDSDRRRRAHAKLAEALPKRALYRAHHLIAAHSSASDETTPMTSEVLAEVSRLVDLGRFPLAAVTIEQALHTLGAAAPQDQQLALLRAWAGLIGSMGPLAWAPLRRALAKHAHLGLEATELSRFLDAFSTATTIGGTESIEALEGLRFPKHERLEFWRLGAIASAASTLDTELEEQILDRMQESVDPSSEQARRILDWRGRAKFRQSEFAEAARLHRSAARTDRPDARITSRINATRALCELGDFKEARSQARRALRDAETIRSPARELWALHLEREIDLRTRRFSRPDLELVEHSRAIAGLGLHASVTFFEASHAWRVGELERAGELWTESADTFEQVGQSAPASLARLAVAALTPGEVPPGVAVGAWQVIAECRTPGLALQGETLAARSGIETGSMRTPRGQWAEDLAHYPRDAPREVLSLEECSSWW